MSGWAAVSITSLGLASDLFGTLLPSMSAMSLRDQGVGVEVAADALIVLAGLLIPAALLVFMARRRQASPLARVIVLIAVLATLFAASQLLDMVAALQSSPAALGVGKLLIAALLLATTMAVVPLLPRLLAMRSPEELAEVRQQLREEAASRQFAEEALQLSLAELNRTIKELEQFSRIASHDLQTPLRTISGFSQLLNRRHRDQLQGDAVEFLDFIDKGARQMQSQINDLLSLSRLDRWDASAITRRPLADTITRTLSGLQVEIEQSAAEIAFGTLPEIEAHHGLLGQLLGQLIDNAIKFRRPGIRPQIRIGIERCGGYWLLTVADNGIGIPVDQLDTVFGIFRRLHGPGVYEGTGIGLAICRKIAAHHGGEITATSDDGGTRFLLRLPIVIPDQRNLLLIQGRGLSAAA